MSTYVGYVLQKEDSKFPYSLLRQDSDWGLETLDLAMPPRRFWSDSEIAGGPVEVRVEIGNVKRLPSPAELLSALPQGDNWQSQSKRSLARLQAHFLLVEDPQRRLDARDVDTLSHQVSLVRHILQNDNLRRVLIADEVGLGKTVEVGLILRELLQQRPELRVLYLAPARLVGNVRAEFDRLRLPFRQWSAQNADGRLTDPKIIASLQRAVHGDNFKRLRETTPWDVLIVDECHHLSAWEQDGGKASEGYSLVRELINQQPPDGRVILMSGTPHQGHETRFENLLDLLRGPKEQKSSLAGRVIYRIKDDIRDWEGNPVFPDRKVNEPFRINLGPEHKRWMTAIHNFYRPSQDAGMSQPRRRAAGWRCAQAMQWAASSPNAGLGYLTRQAIRAGWKPDNQILREALTCLRPYRLGTEEEDIDSLYRRIYREVQEQQANTNAEDIEESDGDILATESLDGLEELLAQGIELVQSAGDEKWQKIKASLLDPAGDEKIVLFAQPIETVTALARFLERTSGTRPSIIIGGQDEARRKHEVAKFRRVDGPQFLVSSRAGGEGINLQIARRLIHIDVPWNPMDLEQRVGRVHRFGSRETIIVDTVVVEDSREAHAYEIARQRLKEIVKVLKPEQFENVFGRVMGLLGQDELQEILVSDPTSPFSSGDETRLAKMVQDGYDRWNSFHEEYGKDQKTIGLENPGQASWDDVKRFLAEHAGASSRQGFKTSRFKRNGNSVRRIEEDAEVLALQTGNCYVCGDYAEALVYDLQGRITPKLGLNLPAVSETMRKAAFPNQPVGAAWLRLENSEGADAPGRHSPPYGILAFVRLTLKQDSTGQWSEIGNSMHIYLIREAGIEELTHGAKGDVVRRLLDATIRKTTDAGSPVVQALQAAEVNLLQTLRRPSEEELRGGIRHAVMPLFAATVSD